MKIASIVLYLVVTIAMITFIMMQRGSGAGAGSGFGAGASGTVFGARGSANFLSSATKWLAVAFFALSLGMAVYETRVGLARQSTDDLGIMGNLPPVADTPDPNALPSPDVAGSPDGATGEVPATVIGDAPAASTVEDTTAPSSESGAAAVASESAEVTTSSAPTAAESAPDSATTSPQLKEKQP